MGRRLSNREHGDSLGAIGELFTDLIGEAGGVLSDCEGGSTVDIYNSITKHRAKFWLMKRGDEAKIYNLELDPPHLTVPYSEFDAGWQFF